MVLRFVSSRLLHLGSPGLEQDRHPGLSPTHTDLRSLNEAVAGDRVAAVSWFRPTWMRGHQTGSRTFCRLKGRTFVGRVGLDYDLWADRLLAQAGKFEISRRAAPAM